ncbi:MAG: hypothetical protein JKX81_00120, partial [Arenicella sp.]|nr:hypothetical protein [Arenicella sp.]
MAVISTVVSATRNVVRGIAPQNRIILIALALVLCTCSSHAQPLTDASTSSYVDDAGYQVPAVDESEFDNQGDSFVKDWREATPKPDYDDTEFGQQIYNEASTPTKLEILRLLSKDTPSIVVFLTAISMGLDIESVLQASVKYEPEKSRDLASSAVNLLPILTQSSNYLYSSYELEDLERENEQDPYSVEEVVENFFKQRLVLRPYPDWFEGQFHFMASASELQRLQSPQKDVRWYRTKSTKPTSKRPIFVSLYEATSTILIDGEERITDALKKASNGRVLLEVFEPGMVIPAFSITEGVRDKKIEAGYTWLGYDQGRIPATPLISAVPFGMEPWEFTAWYFEDEGRGLTESIYHPHDVHPILCGVIGPETAGWFRKRIGSLQDFQGLKI